jgi:hypothetical protein
VGNLPEGTLAGVRSDLINRERLRALGSDPPTLRHSLMDLYRREPFGTRAKSVRPGYRFYDAVVLCLRLRLFGSLLSKTQTGDTQ